MIYSLTAIGLPHGTVVQYTFTYKQYIEKHNENRTYVTTRIHKQTIKIHMVPSPSIRVLVACRYAARVRTDCREKVVGRA